MDLGPAFLSEIIARPDDDGVRLIYADWLMEQGSPSQRARSEFIQIQIQSAKHGRETAQRLLQREMELRAEFEVAWIGELPIPPIEWTFERGFLSQVRVEAHALVERVEEVFRLHPIQHLGLFWDLSPPYQRVADLQRLCGQRSLGQLRSLDVSHTAIGSAGAAALAGGAHRLPSLTHLNASHCHIGDAGLRGLMLSPLLAQLTELNLSGNDLTNRGIRHLVERIEEAKQEGLLGNLRVLDLSRNRLGVAGQHALRYLRPIVRLN